MKQLIYLALVAILVSACITKKTTKPQWEQLFNGKNLDGWDVKFAGRQAGDNYKNTFRVEDGILKVAYTNYDSFAGEFGHLVTQKEFSHYLLRAEYRFIGEQIKGGPSWGYRNNGLMLHCQSAASMDTDQNFPVSIEVQLLGGIGSDDRNNLSVCTPGTLIDINGQTVNDHCYDSKFKVINGEDWQTVEVEVNGDSLIKHIANGVVVLQYSNLRLNPEDPGYEKLLSKEYGDRLKKGHIAIQAESHPTEFRKIEILDLTK